MIKKSFYFFCLSAIAAFLIFNFVYAATNIDSTDRWAWNDTIGWIDFYGTNTVNVSSAKIAGYASSSVGFIAFDCATSPNGSNICGTSNFKISNDGGGNLSGWAYNDNIGWISFASTTPIVYSVSIDSAGDFHGWAWNDIIGWISFNSLEGGGSYSYKVKTGWSAQAATGTLTSSIFDTQVANGAAINTIMWQGTKNGGAVKFQIASSDNSNGPWIYYGPNNTSLDSDVYSVDSNTPIVINPIQHNNKRYVRYKVILESNLAQTQSPTVDDIIINWSP
ncbi:hypothetical protein HZB06_00850 [Candidatus Wolfebacteria bacterium]|nr:hypothetical protein [Candidatus Wolfebacteria bacterium]